MFVNNLNAGIESFLMKFAEHSKLGKIAKALEDRSRIKSVSILIDGKAGIETT